MSGSDLDNWIVISQAAWENTKNMLPSLQLLYGNVYWNPVNGQGLCMHVAAWLYLLLRQEGKAPLLASVQGHLIGHAFIHCDGFLLDPLQCNLARPAPSYNEYRMPFQEKHPGTTKMQ